MKLRDLMTESSEPQEIEIPLSGAGYFDKSEFPEIINQIFNSSEIEKMEKVIDKLRAQNDASYNYNRNLPQTYLDNLNKISQYIAKRLEKNGYSVSDTGEDDDTLYIVYE